MRLARRLVQALTGLLLVLAVGAVGLVIALRQPAVQAEVRARLATMLADATGARVSIGSVGTTFLGGIRARDVRLAFPAGARVGAAELAGSSVIPALLARRLELGTVRLRGVRVRLAPEAPAWGFDDLVADAEAAGGPLPDLRVLRVVVDDGRVAVHVADPDGPWRVALDDVALDAGLTMDANRIRVTVATLSGVPRGIAVTPIHARGVVTVDADGSALALEDLDVATRRSRLTGGARITFDRRLEASVDLAPLSARELRALVPAAGLRSDVSGRVAARGPWSRIALRAALATPVAGAVRLFGVLDAGGADLPYRARARVRHLDLAAIDGTLPASNLTGHVRGRGALTTLASPLAFRLRLEPSVVAGQQITAARATGHLVADGLAARGAVTVPAGRAAVDGRLSWTGQQPYAARVRARIDDLALLAPGTPGRGRLSGTVEGHGFDRASRALAVRAQLGRGVVRGVRLDGGSAALGLRGDLLTLDAGTILAGGLRADAGGTLDLGRRMVDASGSVAGDVTRAARAAGAHAAGTLAGRATVRGALHALAVDAAATLERLHAGTTTVERAGVTARLTGVGGDAARGRATVDATGVQTGASQAWAGTAVVDWTRTGGVDTALTTVAAGGADGARAAGRGTVRRTPAGALAIELAELLLAPVEQPAWALVAPARIVADGGLVTVDRLELAAGAQRVTLGGRAGLTGQADATVEWRDVDLSALCTLRDLACGGYATGSARITGVAAAPHLAVTLRAESVSVERSPITTITMTGDYAGRVLAVRGTVDQAEAGQLDITGRLPLDLAWDGPRQDLSGVPIDLGVRTGGLDLAIARIVAPDSIREISGRAVADLRLSGTWDDLRADGSLALRDGHLALAATGVAYQDIELAAVARGETIEIQTVRARAGEGTLEGGGSMALVATRTTPFTLQLRFADFLAVSRPGYEAATDGTLSIGGALAYPVVRGDLALTRLLVRPTALTETSGPSLEPDPTIEVVGLDAPAPVHAPDAPALDVADALSLDVGIHVVRDAWIRRKDADVELRGDLRVSKAAHHPLFVTGEIRLVRGWYAFQGRRFEVDEGRIVFGGDVPPDPQLDLTAINKTADYEVTVRITGRASEPVLALSSSPPLEQADILALLVFGRPARDLGREESIDLQRQAISLASGYIVPELRESVMNSVGLDTFELGDEGLRAGRYVTRDVFVTLAQDFTGRAGQTMGMEYAVTRRLSLKMSTSTQGTSAVDLLWRRRY